MNSPLAAVITNVRHTNSSRLTFLPSLAD